ncbi:MAG: exo-alpha-sialidase [Pedobacter sp.]|nr:MAG: exo-alpha-sialidase [Pedobacter sp.]
MLMRLSTCVMALIFALLSCTSGDNAEAQQKISQFERAGLCDLLIDKAGVYHAVFQESPAIGKPMFIYYSSSANKGASWSKPVNISNDNTGNGAGYPRILQDGSGRIYAIWKRYGTTTSRYPIPDVILDGPGGYTVGTIFYKTLSGNNWSNAVQLNESEGAQNTWFATLTPQGTVQVYWAQASPESIKNNWLTWYFCDFLRCTTLNGSAHTGFVDLSTPSQPAYAGGAPPKEGAINLQGYVDQSGVPHLVFEEAPVDVQVIKYFDGKTTKIVYTYPLYNAGNTFHYPAKLLVDERGTDHLLFKPSPATLESEQIWDMNLATNQTNILAAIQKKGVTISNFQAVQGPGGSMAVTFEAGTISGNTEAYGSYYQGGSWKNVALTNNAGKEEFFTTEFRGLGGYRTTLSTLTKYNSKFGAVAYDGSGKKSMLMTIAAYWSAGGYNTSDPSIVFVPIDR